MAKRVTAIVSLSIIGVLILATIIMSVVPVNHKINLKTPNDINIYNGSTSETPIKIDDGGAFNKVIEYVNNSTKENALTALFNGTLFNNPEIVTQSANSLTSISSNSSSAFVVFRYTNPQVLMDGNKEYKDEDGKRYYYQGLCFEVSSSAEEYTKVYIIPYYKSNGDKYEPTNNVSLQYHRYYNLKANLSNLYSYLSELNYIV